MKWSEQTRTFKVYLSSIYVLALPLAVLCFTTPGTFGPAWLFLTITSVFVATINVRLPKISSVISMGDVFVILALLQFGAAPALITYWIDITTAHLSDVVRKHGKRFTHKIFWHRFCFNLSCCALSVSSMYLALTIIRSFGLVAPLELL